jgi:hypothetical protein
MSTESSSHEAQPSPLSAHPDFGLITRRVVKQAREATGSASKLALELDRMGINGDNDRPYSDSAISNWTKGRTRMPGDVLLGLAYLSGTSLDEIVGIRGEAESAKSLRQGIDEIRGMVADLYLHLGLEMPDVSSLQASDHVE